ncbi:MAG: Uma2 family endonuclease [Nitrospira sp.]|nr:Uma2 family endonuclease [Nitrospira sp.]MCP9460794.1 Uma2 family endonuclease [Nitrospira sp.]MCP9475009.1 Uma2 family endonuclease [Nitrospira sp.]
MSTTSRSTKLTYEDYILFPDDGRRHELIQGDHFMTPAPNTKHQRILGHLHVALYAYLRQHNLGQVYIAPYDVVLSDEDVVQPDLLFISTARLSIVTDTNVRGAPDLIVEILSEATRKKDEITKRKLYERYGVQEYWLADPELETVKILRLSGAHYVRAAELVKEAHDVLTTPLLPGFSLPLAEIFD